MDRNAELKKMNKEELVALIIAYDNYIQEANDEDTKYSTGWRPVCLMEFNDNEFQQMLEEEVKWYMQ